MADVKNRGKNKTSRSKKDNPNGRYGGGNLSPMAEMEMGGKATYHSDDVRKVSAFNVIAP